MNGPNNDLRLWSKFKLIVLKNKKFVQIIETQIKKHKIILINVHLINLLPHRKKELKEIAADIEHLKRKHKEANVICPGDFNKNRAKAADIGLIIRSEACMIWRKNRKSRFTRGIDHFLSSEFWKVPVEYREKEADHKAMIGKISTTSRCKGIAFPVLL